MAICSALSELFKESRPALVAHRGASGEQRRVQATHPPPRRSYYSGGLSSAAADLGGAHGGLLRLRHYCSSAAAPAAPINCKMMLEDSRALMGRTFRCFETRSGSDQTACRNPPIARLSRPPTLPGVTVQQTAGTMQRAIAAGRLWLPAARSAALVDLQRAGELDEVPVCGMGFSALEAEPCTLSRLPPCFPRPLRRPGGPSAVLGGHHRRRGQPRRLQAQGQGGAVGGRGCNDRKGHLLPRRLHLHEGRQGGAGQGAVARRRVQQTQVGQAGRTRGRRAPPLPPTPTAMMPLLLPCRACPRRPCAASATWPVPSSTSTVRSVRKGCMTRAGPHACAHLFCAGACWPPALPAAWPKHARPPPAHPHTSTPAGVQYGSRNVLADPEVREGVKRFTAWPTVPQVGGVGGGLRLNITPMEVRRRQQHASQSQPTFEAALLQACASTFGMHVTLEGKRVGGTDAVGALLAPPPAARGPRSLFFTPPVGAPHADLHQGRVCGRQRHPARDAPERGAQASARGLRAAGLGAVVARGFRPRVPATRPPARRSPSSLPLLSLLPWRAISHAISCKPPPCTTPCTPSPALPSPHDASAQPLLNSCLPLARLSSRCRAPKPPAAVLQGLTPCTHPSL